MGNMLPEEAVGLLPVYTAQEYVGLMLLFVSTVLMAVSIITVISAFSKSVKEANTSATLVSTVVLMCSTFPQLGFDFSAIGWRCVPVLNTAITLNEILVLECSAVELAVTCTTNLVCMLILVFVLSKMFSSEKIMFNKG